MAEPNETLTTNVEIVRPKTDQLEDDLSKYSPHLIIQYSFLPPEELLARLKKRHESEEDTLAAFFNNFRFHFPGGRYREMYTNPKSGIPKLTFREMFNKDDHKYYNEEFLNLTYPKFYGKMDKIISELVKEGVFREDEIKQFSTGKQTYTDLEGQTRTGPIHNDIRVLGLLIALRERLGCAHRDLAA